MSDLKAKVGSFAASDNRGSWEVTGCAEDWSLGSLAPDSMIKHESDEIKGAGDVLPNPHNKRGPKTGQNAPFDAAALGWDGRAVNQSYADDPPIGSTVPAANPGGYNADSGPMQVSSGFGA